MKWIVGYDEYDLCALYRHTSKLSHCRRFRDSQHMRDFCGLADPEDRVFGCFVLGRARQNLKLRGSRRDWREKVTWK